MTAMDLTVWALVGGLAAIAFGTRGVFILPEGRHRLPEVLERLLRFAPAAALFAIIVPDIARVNGQLDLTWGNHRLIAGLVAFAVAAYTRNIVLTIAVGLLVLLAGNALF